MAPVTRIVTGIEAVVGFAGRLAAWICVALVLLVAGDVFARYFFRTGAVWVQELQWHLISPIALFGMSYALMAGEQVRVDVLYERFPPGLRRAIEVLGGALMIAFGLVVAWLSWPWVEMAYLRGEGSSNPGGLPHRSPERGDRGRQVPDPVCDDQVDARVRDRDRVHARHRQARRSPKPASAPRAAAATSMGHDRSTPSTSHPPAANGTALRPAPQPRSSARRPPEIASRAA